MAGIFICYRRVDTAGWAGRLYADLKAGFRGVNIFMDIEAIPPGVNFDEYIAQAVGSCDVLIALIGPHWLTASDNTGKRRLDDLGDFTRIEIATALKRNIRVVPALLGGAKVPSPDDLPEDLKPLARRHGYELADHRWVEDCTKLIAALKPIVQTKSGVLHKVMGCLALALVLGLAGYGVNLWHDHHVESEARKAETARKAEEHRQVQEANRRAEEAGQIEEARKAEQNRRIEEAQKTEAARKAEESRQAQEASRRAEEAGQIEEARKAEQNRQLEEAKKIEAARKTEESRQIQEASRREEEARQIEERKAEQNRRLEEARRAEAARQAEQRKKKAEQAPEREQVPIPTKQLCVDLVRPAANAVLSQRRVKGGKVQTVWQFLWRGCPEASRYHLYVIGPGALNPIVNIDTLTTTTYQISDSHYGITQRRGWTWMVRANVGGRWGDWSEKRTFNVALPE